MKHLDLFSGIGGFSLAADRVWSDVEHEFVEYDTFCQEVLKKHWPNSKIHGDIREYTDGTADLVTGGFPCQPFSQAGRRKGTADDRYLWPEMFRVIQLTKPQWVIAENVRGLVTWNDGMVLEQVCSDLESEGYEVQPLIIPAIAVNAPHRRDRVWFVANHKKSGWGERNGQRDSDEGWAMGERGQTRNKIWPDGGTGSERRTENKGDAPHPKRTGHKRKINQERQSARHNRGTQSPDWSANWLEVATRLCGVFNGLSTGLDKDMSDGIYLKHAETRKQLTRQNVPCLWQGFQSQAFQWRIGRFDTIQDKDYVFTVLWQLSHFPEKQDDISFESAIVQEAYVRNVWHDKKLRCPPFEWRYNRQYAEEHKDALSQLSHEVALVASEIKEAYTKNRNPRLKALGNAIVPQVAEEIMRAIPILNRTN